MITKYLPEFKVFEVGSLTGLRAGHMLSQCPVDVSNIPTVTFTSGSKTSKFIENGIIVGLNTEGKIVKYTNQKTMFVHYTEELNTFIDELKYFAVPVEDNEETYIRCIALYAGDSFCTNNVTGAPSAYAKVDNGVLTFVAAENKATAQFAVKEGTLPTGEKAYDFVFLGA